ncbi:MAG TPA: hypothetical protein VNJ09_04155 [Chthonomonadales bacterium]|nr:hypothetical protein [Chthonomonadales bacterium]
MKEDDRTKGFLPYRDTKPVGAADFYFAINATFRFLLNRFGEESLRKYWTDLGEQYFEPVSKTWKEQGLKGVAGYWREFFAAEPGSEVEVAEATDSVTLHVKVCPAIKHLRAHGREIVPCFCQHCYFVGEAMARKAGFTVRVQGGNGSCQQMFYSADADVPPQDMTEIEKAK